MVAIPLDKINCNKVSKYANILIFKELHVYPKTENVSYYLKYICILTFARSRLLHTCISEVGYLLPSSHSLNVI